MIAILAIVGFVAAGLIIGLVATSRAPYGYQDENGFHYGPQQEVEKAKSKEEVPCRVPRPRLA